MIMETGYYTNYTCSSTAHQAPFENCLIMEGIGQDLLQLHREHYVV